jgi:hypothetical protein
LTKENMMKHLAAILILVALVIPGRLLGHEGHEHKVMGVVTAVDSGRLEIETKGGEKVSVVLEKETRFFRGKTRAAASDLKVGQRVAVFYVEKQRQNMAQEVLLGVGETPADKPK